MTRRSVLVVAGTMAILSAARVSAQGSVAADLRVGVLSTNTGSGPTATAAVSRSFLRDIVVGEIGLGYATFVDDVSFNSPPQRTHVAIGDLEAQLQLPLRWVRPYGGVAIGMVRYLTELPREKTVGSVSAALGVRVPVGKAALIRVDYRLREWTSPLDAGFYTESSAVSVGVGFRR